VHPLTLSIDGGAAGLGCDEKCIHWCPQHAIRMSQTIVRLKQQKHLRRDFVQNVGDVMSVLLDVACYFGIIRGCFPLVSEGIKPWIYDVIPRPRGKHGGEERVHLTHTHLDAPPD